MRIEAVLGPAELPTAPAEDAVCVVFDVLRATSAFVTGLHHGAEAVVPVADVGQALAWRRRRPDVLLGGERGGERIDGFDLGNSPSEYAAAAVSGRVVVSTTTNGTRALRACAAGRLVLAASLLNLAATVEFLLRLRPERVLLVCAGTGKEPALEDCAAAGAACDALAAASPCVLSDPAVVARLAYLGAARDFPAALRESENARRLLASPDLRGDVAFCLRRDVFPLVAAMDAEGYLRRLGRGA